MKKIFFALAAMLLWASLQINVSANPVSFCRKTLDGLAETGYMPGEMLLYYSVLTSEFKELEDIECGEGDNQSINEMMEYFWAFCKEFQTNGPSSVYGDYIAYMDYIEKEEVLRLLGELRAMEVEKIYLIYYSNHTNQYRRSESIYLPVVFSHPANDIPVINYIRVYWDRPNNRYRISSISPLFGRKVVPERLD